MSQLDKKNVEDILALTPLQEGILYHYLRGDDEELFVEQLRITLHGALDRDLVERAWQHVVRTNELLRTVYRWENLKNPIQIIQKETQVALAHHDISTSVTPQDRLHQLRDEDLKRRFNLEDGAFRIALIKLGDGIYELIVCFHHIILDGWSLAIVLREFFETYQILRDGKTPRHLPKTGFKEFVKLGQKCDEGEQRRFWQSYLDGFCHKPALSNPLRAWQDNVMVEQRFEVDEELRGQLNDFCKRNRITLSTLICTVYGLLLQRYTFSQDIVFGLTISGRSSGLSGIEDMVGLFINTLPVRIQASREMSIDRLLQVVQNRLNDLHRFEHTPLVKIKEYCQEFADNDIFDSLVVIENYPFEGLLGQSSELIVDDFSITEKTNYPLTFGLSLFGEKMEFDINYKEETFSKSFVSGMQRHFLNLLMQVLEAPQESVDQLQLLSADDKDEILAHSFGSSLQFRESENLLELLAAQSRNSEDRVAVVFNNEQITYVELGRRAQLLADRLKTMGVASESIVAIMSERSLEMLVGVLAILRAGAAYLPINHEYPAARIEYVINDSRTPILLTQRHIAAEVGDMLRQTCLEKIIHIDVESEESFSLAEVEVKGENLCYVTYTSGTTGQPKGVMTEHRNVVNLLRWFGQKYQVSPRSNVLQLTDFSFDPFVEQTFGTLVWGATLHITGKEIYSDFSQFQHYVESRQISMADIIPSVLKELLAPQQRLSSLQQLVTGGEQLEQATKDALLEKGYHLYNHYGPTETTVDCMTAQCDSGEVVIGRPIANTQSVILDPHDQLQPVGIAGHLHIGGAGLARGYLNQPDLTADRYRSLAINASSPTRYYATGDRARQREDGMMEFVGRLDRQVKIRGFRVELDEIENAIAAHPQVRENCVLVRDDGLGEKRLVAYVARKSDKDVTAWPSTGEYPVYDKLLYDAMANDKPRNKCYRAAIEKHVRGKTVVEIGTGQGLILARMCAESGARKVYAIEMLDSAYHQACKTVKQLELQETIEVLHGNSLELELAERVDVCVSELIGTIGSSEGAIPILKDARKRFLKENGLMIPATCATMIAAVTLPESFRRTPGFDETSAYYAEQVFAQVGRYFDVRICLKDLSRSQLISSAATFEFIDFTKPDGSTDAREVTLNIATGGTLDGFLLWLNLMTSDDFELDSFSYESNWLPVFFPVFDKRLAVAAGDSVQITCQMLVSDDGLHPDYRLSGRVIRLQQKAVPFEYHSVHHNSQLSNNEFYRKILPEGKPRLIARTESEITQQDLRTYLRSRIPEHMLPSTFVMFDELPRNHSGKIDTRSLPAPEASNGLNAADFVAPKTPIEQRLAGIWAEILGREHVGIRDNFFELGGHSLHLIRLSSRLSGEFKKNVSIVTLLKYPSISTLSQYLNHGENGQGGDTLPDRSEEYQKAKSRLKRLMKKASAS